MKDNREALLHHLEDEEIGCLLLADGSQYITVEADSKGADDDGEAIVTDNRKEWKKGDGEGSVEKENENSDCETDIAPEQHMLNWKEKERYLYW